MKQPKRPNQALQPTAHPALCLRCRSIRLRSGQA